MAVAVLLEVSCTTEAGSILSSQIRQLDHFTHSSGTYDLCLLSLSVYHFQVGPVECKIVVNYTHVFDWLSVSICICETFQRYWHLSYVYMQYSIEHQHIYIFFNSPLFTLTLQLKYTIFDLSLAYQFHTLILT